MYVSDLSARHVNVLLFMPSLSCCCRSLQLHIVYLRLLFAVICVVCRSFRSFAYCFATRYTLAQTNTHTHTCICWLCAWNYAQLIFLSIPNGANVIHLNFSTINSVLMDLLICLRRLFSTYFDTFTVYKFKFRIWHAIRRCTYMLMRQ